MKDLGLHEARLDASNHWEAYDVNHGFAKYHFKDHPNTFILGLQGLTVFISALLWGLDPAESIDWMSVNSLGR